MAIGGTIKFLHSAFIEKFRYEGIVGVGMVLKLYASDYETLPPLDKWCDKLIEGADCSPWMFVGWVDREEGKCGYALNENLAGMKLKGLDDKVVLAFESKGEWNLSGGAELAKDTNQKDVAVVFVDGYMDFVQKENIHSLQWKPHNSEEIKRLLQGNWYNYNKEWGLIFKNDKVSEYEDVIQSEGEYIIDVNFNPIKIIIWEDKKEVITFLITFKDNLTLVIDDSEESVVLTKVDNLPH